VRGPQKDPQAALASGGEGFTLGGSGGLLSLGNLQGEGFEDVNVARLRNAADYIVVAQVADCCLYCFGVTNVIVELFISTSYCFQ
jgi:hypothetical protein